LNVILIVKTYVSDLNGV